MSAFPSVRAVAIRVLFVGLFLLGYVTAWRPARDWISGHVMAPLLKQVETPRAQQYVVDGTPDRVVAVYQTDRSAPVASITAPAGALFVVLGSVLVILSPWRPYWLLLASLQLLIGVAMLSALAIGIGWHDGGFVAFNLLNTTVYPGTSLATPLVIYGLQTRKGDSSSSPEPDSATT